MKNEDWSIPGASALFTDFYELTMAQGYWKQNMNQTVVFDMFFRKNPFNGGFSVFAGIETLLDTITNFRFSEDDIEYLKEQKIFEQGFLDYLKDFKFTGDLYSMAEGTVIFPQEPLVRIHAKLIETLIIMASVYVLSITCSIIMNTTIAVITQGSLKNIRLKMFKKMEKLPIRYFDQNTHGDIMSHYTNDTDSLRQLIGSSMTTVVQSGIMVLVLLGIMLSYSIWLAIIIFLGIFNFGKEFYEKHFDSLTPDFYVFALKQQKFWVL